MKEKDTQVQIAQSAPKKMNQKRPMPRLIIIKMAMVKDKEIILKIAREKQIFTYKGAPKRLSADLSTETFQARGHWHEIFKVKKIKNLESRLLYSARLLFKIQGETKSFPNKKRLK